MVQKMPIPTRSAPRPPSNYGTQFNSGWSNNDPFGATSTTQAGPKKKPPPRPPPPRFKKDYALKNDDKTKKPARPTELLSNIFGRRAPSKRENVNGSSSRDRFYNTSLQNNDGRTESAAVSLIDLSPPGSPTFTTRSSSDGVSVDSFGSDGNSNPSAFTSSGNTSQTESAFEDDFDFFGSLASNEKTQTFSNDPWKLNRGVDSSSTIKRVGDSNFFAHNDFTAVNRTNCDSGLTNFCQTMPTIIRARPTKPPAPKFLNRNLAPIVTDFNAIPSVSSTSKMATSAETSGNHLDSTGQWPIDDFDDNPSPPMPSIPPPAPPAEYVDEIKKSNPHLPRGVALYDFAASQSGDLTLKQGEIVNLTRIVNDEWLEGEIGDRRGIFPSNFIDVVVPLPGLCSNVVNALYTFNGETWEDLPFEEGAKITVLSRISDDWLYGEYRGKRGQFPANYIDRVPQNLPKSS